MESTIIFPTKEVDLQNYYFYAKGFSDHELETIYKNVENIPFMKGGTGEANDNDLSVRSSSVKWIPKDAAWAWLYDKMMAMVVEANNSLWNFDLYTVLDSIQYTEYHANKGGHYDWHQDIGPGWLSKRKVSITVQLSGPDEYTGGDLEYWRGGNIANVDKVPKDKGVVFIFPSFMMHRVTKVETGIRRSFVLWVGGEHYK